MQTEQKTHDDVAREIEQELDAVEMVEGEGPDTTRVDFVGEQSVWLSTFAGKLHATGHVSRRVHRALLPHLAGFDTTDLRGLEGARQKANGNRK